MNWWRRWLRRRVPNGSGQYREFVEQRLETTKQMTPLMHRFAPHVAQLPPEELADRLRRAMTPRQT